MANINTGIEDQLTMGFGVEQAEQVCFTKKMAGRPFLKLEDLGEMLYASKVHVRCISFLAFSLRVSAHE